MKTVVRILAALLVVRLILMVVVPVFEPSEARYAAISANMARTGDFVVPRFTYDCTYQVFEGKPPLFFQASGAVIRALRANSPYALQFAARVVPLASALLLLALVYYAVKRTTGDRERAGLAVVICASCTTFFALAGIAMIDMLLTCCVAGALLLYEVYLLSGKWLLMAGIAVLLGAGMITKGPVALVLFGLPVLVDAIAHHHWKRLFDGRWLTVAPLFLLVAVPWFVLIEQRNPGSVWYFFYNENFMRFISHDYGDKYGAGRETFRGMSIVWAFVATLPWALVPVWNAIKRRDVRGMMRDARGTLASFDVLALLTMVGFWCLTSRVLLYYLIPVVPLFASALAKGRDVAFLKRLSPWCAGATALLVAALLVTGMFTSERMLGAKTPFEWWEDRYANEFYNGTLSELKLEAWREVRAEQEQLEREKKEKRKEKEKE